MTDLTPQHPRTLFDTLTLTRQDGSEFWCARDLMAALGYTRWENFQTAITRAMEACESSVGGTSDHFRATTKMIPLGKGGSRDVLDYHLTRYGAYLLAMNSDPSKGAVALAQTYFAVRTHEAETRPAAPPTLPASPLAMARMMLETLEQQDARLAVIEHRLDTAPITGEHVSTIYRLGRELGQAIGDYSRAWRLIKDRFNLASYRDLPTHRFEECAHFIRVQIAAYTGRAVLLDERPA